MIDEGFARRRAALESSYDRLIAKRNESVEPGNGVYSRWRDPVITRNHVPLDWRYDFSPETNPNLVERIGVNATFNSGAIYIDGRYLLVVRVEGNDRKSFFAIAESNTGVDGFRFWPRPLVIPELDDPDINVYDIRLTCHEDGYIYGLFCSERRDDSRPDDPSAATASCGIVRTSDLKNWERLPDLVSNAGQQRNCVLHPEFVDGKYALYTRPQDGFVEVGEGGGLCWALTDSMQNAFIEEETAIDRRVYHTVNELKNGQGPPPLKTPEGWLHLAHGVRQTAAGLRYVLYMFMTALNGPSKIIRKPAGYFLAPIGKERIGDVSNVVFCNGWIRTGNDDVFIYYASSDTRVHVATSTITRLLDYCLNTPPDGLRSATSVAAINALIDMNARLDDQ